MIEKESRNKVQFVQVAADTLYQARRNIFLELLLSSYDKNTNGKRCPHFGNRK